MYANPMNTLKVCNIELGAGVPKTIVPIVAKTSQVNLDKAAEVTQLPADLIEWRADFYEDLFNIPTLRDTLHEMWKTLGQMPILFTIRTKPEGVEIAPSFEDYARLNLAVAKSVNADLVDVEMFWGNADWNGEVSDVSTKFVDEIHKAGCKVVGVRHSFLMTPERKEISATLLKQQEAGADILNVAVMPNSDADVVTLIGASVDYKWRFLNPLTATMRLVLSKLPAVPKIPKGVLYDWYCLNHKCRRLRDNVNSPLAQNGHIVLLSSLNFVASTNVFINNMLFFLMRVYIVSYAMLKKLTYWQSISSQSKSLRSS